MHLSITPSDRVHYKIRHQDEHLLVVDKPQGVVTQPGLGHQHDTLLNGLFARFGAALQNLGKDRDFGLLHRLDKHTSGLVVVALRPQAYDRLREAFATRKIRKFYWAIACRAPRKPAGVIDRPLLENTDQGEKLARVSPKGKPALTAYRTLAVSPVGSGPALLECRPVTGRLHQVRAHLASIGCALLGDTLYARPAVARAAPRVALHAHRLVFAHPVTDQTIDVHSPWPRDLDALRRTLRLPKPGSVSPSASLPTPSPQTRPEDQATEAHVPVLDLDSNRNTALDDDRDLGNLEPDSAEEA